MRKDHTAYHEWVKACRDLNANENASRDFRDIRYAFTHKLATLLIQNLPQAGDDQVVYAVHLTGAHRKPVYLGTSCEGLRRLWDLPIGESHHLSNTFPPEIWERVQVLEWKLVLSRQGHNIQELVGDLARRFGVTQDESLKILGMGIEFLFQKFIQPEINTRTKCRVGGFKAVDYEKSGSRQAIIAKDYLGPMFPTLLDAWQRLWREADESDADVHVSKSTPGFVVFPGRVYSSLYMVVQASLPTSEE